MFIPCRLLITWTICLYMLYSEAMADLQLLCTLPSVTGPCRAAITRYYFNTDTKQCETFIFGGCGGNANNFGSLAQCRSACTCNLPMSMGIWKSRGQQCTWQMPRYYDSSRSVCRRFLFWGCGGNGNRFETSRECYSACAASRCYGPRQSRRCWFTKSQRYFYNSASNLCESFIYRGCSDTSSENQFETKLACEGLCTS